MISTTQQSSNSDFMYERLLTRIANSVGSLKFLIIKSFYSHDIPDISSQNTINLIIIDCIGFGGCKELSQHISVLKQSPVEKEGNFTARSDASFRVLLALKLSNTAASSSSSKSSMSSTVNCFSCVESKDSDLDTFETTGDGAKTGDGAETATGGTVETATGGGALLGGEPEV